VPDHLLRSASLPHQTVDARAAAPAEGGSWLCAIPVCATGLYYLLPPAWQDLRLVQFLPQLLAYIAFGLWLVRNDKRIKRLGLSIRLAPQGLVWGFRIGLALGLINVSIILWVVPWVDYDISFLRDTPHARIPLLIMVPWFICAIALFVEINFRGFLLGRLLVLLLRLSPHASRFTLHALAVGLSALTFSFDPFMVVTFRHLHWIAVWDGIVWGLLWVRLRNLYAPIVAHAVEVIVMYLAVRTALE
jgi:membrane protease YdiL (CAAX protease family)